MTYDSGRTIWASALSRNEVGKRIEVEGRSFLVRHVERGGMDEPVFVDVVTQIRINPREEVVVHD